MIRSDCNTAGEGTVLDAHLCKSPEAAAGVRTHCTKKLLSQYKSEKKVYWQTLMVIWWPLKTKYVNTHACCSPVELQKA